MIFSPCTKVLVWGNKLCLVLSCLDRVPFLASRIGTGCLFELPVLAPALACFLLISQAIFKRILLLFSSLTADSLNFSEKNIKKLENTIKI